MENVYKFTKKHQYSTQNHLLSGITFFNWIRLLYEHWNEIEWFNYAHRILFLTILSILNSIFSIPDTLLYHWRLKKRPLPKRPIFILGHPRTGTTHLHNLISLDEEQFTFANAFMVGFPHSFLSCESFLSKLFAPLVSPTRPMDNMPLSLKTPCEDEIASNSLSSGCSPYMPLIFPRKEKLFRQFYNFENAPKNLFNRWFNSFVFLLKKVSWKSEMQTGKEKRIIIKSPVHTARVKLLLSIFPDAQFIYIHRNPYEVFQSAANMADTYYWYCYLQTPRNEDILEFIFYQYELLFDLYTEERKLIPKENLFELSFEELEKDPILQMEKIYEKFQWRSFDYIRPTMEKYCAGLADFKKNHFNTLSPEVKKIINQRWAKSFTEFSYPMENLN